MELNIAYLYYDILNVYGDRGNVLILKNIIEVNNIKCNIKYITTGNDFKDNECDIVFIGGGQDNDQILAGKDLIRNKKDNLQIYIEDGGCGLYICGAYQLLGKKYVAANGTEIEGAGIFDIYTEKGENRFKNNIVIRSTIFKTQLVGFENHSGRTFIKDYEPLGYVKYGHGNNGQDKTEGLVYKNSICTYMHGCFLSKNPEITRFIIENALKRKYRNEISLNINESLFNRGKNAVINRFVKRY